MANSVDRNLAASARIFYDFMSRQGNPYETHPRGTMSVVNIRDLVRDLNALSPTKWSRPIKSILPYNDVYVSGKAIDVILRNFALAQNEANNFDFYKFALKHLCNIFEKHQCDELYMAQLSILVHISKWIKPFNFLSSLYMQIDEMRLSSEITTEMQEWKDFGIMAIGNSQVNETIEEEVKKFDKQFNASTADVVEIIFIECADRYLRGYSGCQKIYVNNFHFQTKKIGCHVPQDRWKYLFLFDFASLIIHEYSQVMLRKISNDFNLSSPQLAEKNRLPMEYAEFGRLIETKVFGKAVNWLGSGCLVTQPFLRTIQKAFEDNDNIPDCSELISRGDCTNMGVDYEEHSLIE